MKKELSRIPSVLKYNFCLVNCTYFDNVVYRTISQMKMTGQVQKQTAMEGAYVVIGCPE